MGRREGRTSRRPRATRPLATRILIVCGGLRTEKQYFEGLRRAERNAAVKIEVKAYPKSPTEVVRHAVKLRKLDRDDFDEVWCVLDVDEFRDIEQAAAIAKRNGVRVAVSNPCFELWLLLHHADHTSHISTAEVLKLLCKHLPAYDKTELDFRHFADGVPHACGRAERLDPSGASHTRNPTTGVWPLTHKIRRP
ncbi:RloB domain-containing protein [Actinomadura craniellae]|uniref:RloB domain-containing protein n=1 Tax=Actinomadura craniellae TaxID=2231787 RepID=A0A365H7D2_9ACTN|nr:RloB family protein [Actinomadura craniellae]RAY14886.1 RloB domain-containing protein [Actinomadura craniellae]